MNEPTNNPTSAVVLETTKKPKTISIKALSILILIIVLIGLVYYFKSTFIAATVNGQPISRLSIIRELEKQSGTEALEALINEHLINSEARAKNITVSEEELDEQFKIVEAQFAAQGMTFEDALTSQGLTREEVRKQFILQKKAEKLLADKLTVTDEEVDQFIVDREIIFEPGTEEGRRLEIKEQIKQQKFTENIGTWLKEVRDKAQVNIFVEY